MSDLLARLIAAGTPADLIAEVAMLVARAEVDREAIETRRAKDRERQAHRRNVMSRDTADVTAETPSLDKETSPRPPKEIKPNPERGTRAQGARLPEGWKPTKLDRSTVSGQIIESRGQEWAKCALESFDNHWRAANGPNARKRDWQAAWANWVIEQDRRDGKGGRNGQRSENSGGLGRTNAAAVSVFGAAAREPPEPDFEALRRVGPSRGGPAIASGWR